MSDRRTFLTGIASLPLAGLPAIAAPSEADQRLFVLADAYEALGREMNDFKGTENAFEDLCAGSRDIEGEMVAIKAHSLAGVLAKARLCDIPASLELDGDEFFLSIIDDLVRLFPNEVAAGRRGVAHV